MIEEKESKKTPTKRKKGGEGEAKTTPKRKSKGKKEEKDTTPKKKRNLSVEYAKSGRSACKGTTIIILLNGHSL